MTDTNVFEVAARKKFRFQSAKGELTPEQLWDLPLVTERQGGVDLDTIAKSVNADLRSVTEESFVNVKPNPRKGDLEQKLDLVKRIIEVKLAEAETARLATEKAERKKKLLAALADAEARDLAGKSKEELLKELDSLS